MQQKGPTGNLPSHNEPKFHMRQATYFTKQSMRILEVTVKSVSGLATASDYARRARAYYSFAKYKEASEDYKIALELEPGNLRHCLNLGICQLPQDVSAARKTFKQAIGIEPPSHLPFILLGRLEADQDNHQAKMAAYETALAIYMQKPGKSADRLITMLFDYAFACESCMEFERAINAYKHVLHLKPENPRAYEGMGYCYLKMDKYPDSVEYFSKALEIDPENFTALLHMGVVLINQHKNEEAITYLNKSMDVKSAYKGIAFLNRGLAYGNLGKYDQSLLDLDKAAELDASLIPEIKMHKRDIFIKIQSN